MPINYLKTYIHIPFDRLAFKEIIKKKKKTPALQKYTGIFLLHHCLLVSINCELLESQSRGTKLEQFKARLVYKNKLKV